MDRPEIEMDMKDAAKRMDDALEALGFPAEEPQKPDEFAVSELASHSNRPWQTVSRALHQGLRDGSWTRRKVGRQFVWRKVK